MPAGFEKCEAEGGRIKTKSIKGGRYMRICWNKQGKSFAGEVQQSKTKEKK